MGDAVGKIEDSAVVSYDDDRAVVSHGNLGEQVHHSVAGFVVELRGRFIAHDQPRLVNQGTGQRHALLLAARQLRGQGVQPPFESKVGEQRRCPLNGPFTPHARSQQGHGGVFGRGERRKQIVLLENEAQVSCLSEPMVLMEMRHQSLAGLFDLLSQKVQFETDHPGVVA